LGTVFSYKRIQVSDEVSVWQALTSSLSDDSTTQTFFHVIKNNLTILI